MSRKGQVVIWVIIAIFLVASIILFLFIERRVSAPIETLVDEINPRQFIDKCVRENVNDAVDIMLPQGGFLNPGHTKLYNDINISYLCYNSGNYYPCINEHPLLLNEMQDEIDSYITPKVESCFLDLKAELEKRRSGVSLGEMRLDVNLRLERIYVDIDREFIVSKNGEASRFNEFDVVVISPAYELGRLAMEIANQESEFCYFEYVGYMNLYPEFKITKFPMSDDTKIYSLTHKKSGKVMNIAIRSCAIPPGL